MDDGGTDIIFEKMIPGEIRNILYLYTSEESSTTPPKTNRDIYADEGYATYTNMFPTKQQPRWLLRTYAVLVLIGFVASIYLVIELLQWIYRLIKIVG